MIHTYRESRLCGHPKVEDVHTPRGLSPTIPDQSPLTPRGIRVVHDDVLRSNGASHVFILFFLIFFWGFSFQIFKKWRWRRQIYSLPFYVARQRSAAIYLRGV